jgi:hypothetical protein
MNCKIKPPRLRKPRVNSEKIEVGSGNVFADLGFQDAEERLFKAKLATKIAQLIEKKGWTPRLKLLSGQLWTSRRSRVSCAASFPAFQLIACWLS